MDVSAQWNNPELMLEHQNGAGPTEQVWQGACNLTELQFEWLWSSC
jgi:hypothetical protein